MIKAMTILIGALAIPTAQASQLSCPKLAPAVWGVGHQPLESVRVMSYPGYIPASANREYYATPPWEERENAGFIYQTWHLNPNLDEFTYEVDCVYAGTARYLSLDIKGARQCIARWRSRRDHGVVPRSLDFFCEK